MTDTEFAQLTAEARPPIDAISAARAGNLARKSAVTAKTQQLTDMRAESDAQNRAAMAAMLPQVQLQPNPLPAH
ncbi:hypothetical protein [Mycobacterium sp. ENV421]|uniref:hypothetical protein n=1 Tax=Mycobacterium sp. ENV421 TaxID=1213407 RepID=UPI00115B6F3C|nr:hypothetical protein [Mycobacterium sp. ENV421]